MISKLTQVLGPKATGELWVPWEQQGPYVEDKKSVKCTLSGCMFCFAFAYTSSSFAME